MTITYDAATVTYDMAIVTYDGVVLTRQRYLEQGRASTVTPKRGRARLKES